MELNLISRKFSLDSNALKLQPDSSGKFGPRVGSIASPLLSDRVSDGPIHNAVIVRYALVKSFDLVAEDHKVLCV